MRSCLQLTFLALGACALTASTLRAQEKPTVVDSLYEAATASHNAGDHEAALALYDRVLSLDATHADAHWNRANLQYNRGRYDETLAGYRRVTELAPEFGGGYGNLGWVLILLGRSEEAHAPTLRAMELDAESFAWPLNLGHVHLLGGRSDSARVYYEAALRTMETEEELAAAVATFDLFIERGWQVEASEQARSWMRQVFEADRLSGTGMESYRAGTRESLERAIRLWGEAAALYREAGSFGGEAVTVNNIGVVHDDLGRPDSALAYYERALPIRREVGDRGGEAVTLNNIGHVHQNLGRPDSALAYYQGALPIQREVGDRGGEARTLNNIGLVHQDLGRPDSALAYYERALALRREVGDRGGEAVTLNNIGSVHDELGRPDSALAYYGRALPITREVGDRGGEARTLNNIGLVHDDLGRPDSALAYYERALPIRREVGDRRGEARTLNNIGGVHSTLGRPDSALAYYGRALPIQRDVGDRRVEAHTLNNIGHVYENLGRPDSALAYYGRALPITREVGDSGGEATTLNNIGNVHQDLGRPESALAYYGRALPIQREVGDRGGEATTLNNIGLVHQNLGRPDSALAYYERALPIQREVGDRGGEAVTLNNIGHVYQNLGRPDSALAYYGRTLPITREVGNRRVEAGTLNNIGNVYQNLGRPDSALAYYGRALPILREVGDRRVEAQTLGNIGWAYHRAHSPPRPGTAVAYYDSAASALASVARHAGEDHDRLTYAEQNVALFEVWPLAWLELARRVGPESAALAALAAAERGRAQALLELMRTSGSRAQGAGSRVVRAEPGADLTQEGERLARAATSGGNAAVAYLLTPDTLLTWLLLPGGEVEVFRTPVTEEELSAQVATLRRGLGADSAAVRARLALRDVPPLEPVDEDATRGLEVRGGDSVAASAAARQLSEWLLPPELLEKLAASAELVIVPHGQLNLLPFAALPAGPDGEPLGALHPLRYSPSLATLAEIPSTSGNATADAPLVVGNPEMPVVRSYTGEEVRLGPLPGAEAEGEWVSERLGGSLLSGASATESAVRDRLPGASVVHLATHGYAYGSEARARDSFIALAPGEGQDGLLTVGEVLDALPSLSAELVVLSACQTGLGDLKQAEGTVGLQRAFLAKGARSVLVSLWSVSDDATELLMRSFYGHWLAGEGKAEALRSAQEEVRASPGFEHPRYWAAFQLVGAG